MTDIYIGIYDNDGTIAFNAATAPNPSAAKQRLKAREKPPVHCFGKRLLGFHKVKATKVQDAESLMREQLPQVVERYELQVDGVPF